MPAESSGPAETAGAGQTPDAPPSAAVDEQPAGEPAIEVQAADGQPVVDQLLIDQPLADRPSGPLCPWCSQPIAADARTCASCGAAVVPVEKEEELEVPGVTRLDPAIAALAARSSAKKSSPRGAGIASWLVGEPRTVETPRTEIPGVTTPGPLGPAGSGPVVDLEPSEDAFAPPSEDVKLEMLRLELESRRHELEAAIQREVPAEDLGVESR